MRSLALLGSGEFEPWSEEVDRWILGRMARPSGPVLILPTACAPEGPEVWNMWADMGLRHFERLQVPAEVVPLKTHADAARPELVEKLREGSFVYFSGGNPAYLAGVLLGSAFWQALVEGIDEGLGYAGCSAGVSCLGERAPDSARRDFGEDVWQPGLQLFPNVILGPHWDMLDAYVPGLRALFTATVPAGDRLLAIDERTAAMGDGTEWMVAGLGKVHLMEDGSWREWAAGECFTASLLGVQPGDRPG